MILSDSKILEEISNGNIIIEPFNREYLNPCSVDLTIAPKYKVYKRQIKSVSNFTEIPFFVLENKELFSLKTSFGSCNQSKYTWIEPVDVRKANEVEEYEMPEEGVVLIPNQVYLYACNEKIGIKGNIRAKVEGKSSLGRLGLFVHITAGFIDPFFTNGSLVLELVATIPIRIYPNMKICQVEYARVEGDILEGYDQKKGSKYAGQNGVQESLMHLNYKQ